MKVDGERTLWLHAGMPKTATSSAQATFREMAPTLRRHGLAYPPNALRLQNPHHDLVAWFHHDGPAHTWFSTRDVTPDEALSRMRTLWNSVEDLADFDGDVLLSTELMGRARPEGFSALDKAVRETGRVLRVLCYLRHPERMLHSNAQEMIKKGKIGLDDALERPRVRSNSTYLRRIIDVLGRDRVVVRSFEAAVADAGPVRDILRNVGYAGPVDGIRDLRRNESLSMMGTFLAGAYRALGPREAVGPLPYAITAIGGPRFRLPQETLERARDDIETELAFMRDEMGLDVPDLPPEPGETFGRLDESAARDIVRAIIAARGHPRDVGGFAALTRALRGRIGRLVS